MYEIPYKKYGKIVIIPLSHLIKHNPHGSKEWGSGELYIIKIKCEKNSDKNSFKILSNDYLLLITMFITILVQGTN